MVKSKAKIDNLDLFDDLPNPVGRPRQFLNNAERQKAYRARMKANGKRVITRIVADVRDTQELKSDIIDLSEVKKSWFMVSYGLTMCIEILESINYYKNLG